MHAVELPETSSTAPGLHNSMDRSPIKVNERLVEVIYHQQVDKVQHAQGLHINSEDLRKFITSPAANPPRPSLDTRSKMLRLDVLKPSADDVGDDQEDDEEEEAPISVWQAIKNGDFAAVQKAIERDETGNHGMLVNTREPETETTLLYMVAEHVHQQPEQMLQLLLQHGAEPDAPSVYGIRALHAILINCATNPIPAIDILLAHKADINCCDGDGWTPLHYAARFLRDPDPVVRHLVTHGAHVNAVDVTNKTPLFALLANGDHVVTFSWLIHAGRTDLTRKGEILVGQPTSGTVFLQCAKYSRLGCMRELVGSAMAMGRLRKAVSCHELDLATAMLQKRLETKNNQGDLAPHMDELLALAKEFRRVLEKDPASAVANEIYMEKHGKKMALPRQNSLFAALQRRKSKGAFSSNTRPQPQQDAVSEEVLDEDKEPSRLKRMISTLTSSSCRRKSNSTPQQQASSGENTARNGS